MLRLLEVARRQKLRSNSELSQRDLLNSGIDIMETDGELYSEQKQQASRRSAEAQLFAAGVLSPLPPHPTLQPCARPVTRPPPRPCHGLLCCPTLQLQRVHDSEVGFHKSHSQVFPSALFTDM